MFGMCGFFYHHFIAKLLQSVSVKKIKIDQYLMQL